MRSLNRVILTVVILLAAAALASLLRTKGDRHELGGAVDLDGSLEPLKEAFNRWVDHPRLMMVLSPACPVCLRGAEAVHGPVLTERPDLRILAVWMEALPFDITRNPGRRVETFIGEERMVQFYDIQQVAGLAIAKTIRWPAGEPAWDVYLIYPAGVRWDGGEPPEPKAWFHQREIADRDRYRTASQLARAIVDTLPTLPEPAG